MLGRFALGLGRTRQRALTAGKVAFAVSMLAGCSSVPDAINPVAWFGGKDEPEVATPVPGKAADTTVKTADTRRDVAKGLPADKGNSKYAEPVRREVAPTKPLARRAPAPTDTQVAAAPAVPPKPTVVTQELPPTQVAQADGNKLTPGQRSAQARDDGPSAPPASVDMTPPAAADVPVTVPTGRGRPKPLQDQFQRRLAESAQQSVSPGMVAMPRTNLASAGSEEEPIHLVPPTGKRAVKGGGKGMAAPAPEPAASFQVASVDFRANSSDLTAADRSSIAEVARLYRQTGGVVRVVGHAPAALLGGDSVDQMMGGLESSMKRANAVARELSKRGVPASKIMVGADPAIAQGDIGAQVYIDVI
ncbi:MAG: OmpA family protein [Bacteroidota bacterium]